MANSYVYVLKDSDGPFYVGKTCDPWRRYLAHISTEEWEKGFDIEIVEAYIDAETKWIQRLLEEGIELENKKDMGYKVLEGFKVGDRLTPHLVEQVRTNNISVRKVLSIREEQNNDEPLNSIVEKLIEKKQTIEKKELKKETLNHIDMENHLTPLPPETVLTSVKVEKLKFNDFKVECIRDKFTLTKLVNRCIDLYLNDDKFKDFITNYKEA